MAYRFPVFCFEHAARDADSISSAPAADADYPLDRIADNLQGTLCKLGSGPLPWIEIDQGATGPYPILERIIVPPGHNFAGSTIKVTAGVASGTEVQLLASAAAPAGLVDFAFDTPSLSTHRYVRVEWSGTLALEIPELWLTNDLQPQRGPEFSWGDLDRPNVRVEVMASGSAISTIMGSPQRVYSYGFIAMTDADFQAFRDGVKSIYQIAYPFWFYSPDDADTVQKMRFAENPTYVQDHPSPQSAFNYTVNVDMIESTE